MRRLAPLCVAAGAVLFAASAVAGPHVGLARTNDVRLTYAEVSSPRDIEGAHASIWVANADGSRRVRLTTGAQPALSPDGRWIAFLQQRRASVRLDLIPAGGGPVQRLGVLAGAHAVISGLTWAPNSRLLAVYEYDRGTGDLAVVDARTGDRTVFERSGHLEGPEDPSFSPASSEVAYDTASPSGGDIFVYDLRTRQTRQLTHDRRATDPVWGPSWIAYAEPGRRGDVWLMRSSGADKHRLTHTNADIWPAYWSTDGKHLLAANPAEHNGRLWAVDALSGRAHDLTGWIGDLFPQGLSRDGSTILAAIGCGGRLSPLGILETLPFAGGKPTVIAKGPCRGSWNR
jgi:Tol biopolymer transport system component